ncbi:MAG: FHA domain-containing protein [Bdellovibrio sp.]|nr:FHA domain-containing protein [Bdellovibrio sp.]
MPANKLSEMIIEVIKDGETLTYEISKPVLTIGRWHTCDIPINDINISREHLRIIINENNVQIQDLKSSNGTLLNGAQISSKQIYLLTEKDTVTFGNSFVAVRVKTRQAQTVEAPIAPKEPTKAIKTEIVKERTKVSQDVELPPPPPLSISESAVMLSEKEATIAIYEKQESVVVQSVVAQVEKFDTKMQRSVEEAQSAIYQKATEEAAAASKPSNQGYNSKGEDFSSDSKLLSDEAIAESVDKMKFTKEAAFNFKNVGLDLPKYKNSNEHAKEIIRDAEFMKHSIIKKGEAQAIQLIDKAKVKARQESELIHQQCKDMVEQLLNNTKTNLERARIESEKLMSEKRLMLSEEIQLKWDEHDELMLKEKTGHIEKIEKEHRVKLELSLEKLKTDMFIERDQLISNAENEILNKKRKFQLETSQEREGHLAKLREINISIEDLREQKDNLVETIQKVKIEFDKAELDFITATSNLKQISDKSFETQTELDRKIAEFNELELKSKDLIELRNTMTQQEATLKNSIEELGRKYSNLAKKAQDEETKLATLSEQLENNKKVGNAQIEEEFKKTRDAEEKKYQNFKALELKSLQKIKDDHVESIKKYSLELSQEIASKLELLSKKSQTQTFDYTKTVELVHSVIQVKSSDSANIDAKHVEQLASWKKRQSTEKYKLVAMGFAACFVVFFTGNLVYNKLRIDPFEAERRKMAMDRKQSEEENRFVPVKSDIWRTNYVELTLNTDQFVETYLDEQTHQKWVTYISKYFLSQWKVSEEKVIAVVSSSKAFVQSIEEARPELKKTKIKAELEKMKQDEEELVAKNSFLLGSQVRYEAYKKKEQEFFQNLVRNRAPAGK